MGPEAHGLCVAVTGANGYVGGAVAGALADAGHRVVALTRTPDPRFEHREYALAAPLSGDLLAGVDVVVHCAYDWAPTAWDEIVRVNIEGTRALVDASLAAGARFILISSVSAFEGTRQKYGRAKLACERLTLAADGTVVRLGTVYGGANGGMFGLLLRLARLPVIPVIAANSRQALIRLDTVCAALVALVAAEHVHGQLIGLASTPTVELGELLRTISAGRGKPARIVPVPWLPIYALLRLAERVTTALPLRSETILGLARPAPALAGDELWQTLGVQIDPLDVNGGPWV
jgi:nucleoside-diphosphate-sugar epimerase